jgi:hypothetical protein
MNTSGGAVVMGSYPYPPNGIIEIDYEHILVFKKPGQSQKKNIDIKEDSRLTKEEWKELYSGHWNFGGARQVSHEAMFPEELPSRLIKMFTFKGEKVLDPFLGSGTTLKVANGLDRDCIGFELNRDFLDIIREKLTGSKNLEIMELTDQMIIPEELEYEPRIQNASPPMMDEEDLELFRVKDIEKDLSLFLDNGQKVTLAGLDIRDMDGCRKYLLDHVKGKQISIEDQGIGLGHLVFLKNKIYINGEVLKLGYADLISDDFPGKKRLLKINERSHI